MPNKWPQYEIPPIGLLTPEDWPTVRTLIQNFIDKSRLELNKWVGPVRDVCLNLYYYGAISQPGDSQNIVNHLQNPAIRVKDIQFKEPVSVEIAAVDDGGPPLAYYWNGPEQLNIPQVDPQTQQPTMQPANAFDFLKIKKDVYNKGAGEFVAEPIDEQTAMNIQKLIAAQGWPDRWLAIVDGKSLGDDYQRPFDCYWKDARTDEWLDSFVMGNVRGGWRTGEYQWDKIKHHDHTTVPVSQVFLDPRREFVWQMPLVVRVRVFSLSESVRLWPQFADQLRAGSHAGNPDQENNVQFGTADLRDFPTDMVTLTTCWWQDQPIPMTEQEAIQGAHVYVEGELNATIEGQQPTGDQSEYQGNGQGGTPPKAGGGSGDAAGGQAQKAPEVDDELQELADQGPVSLATPSTAPASAPAVPESATPAPEPPASPQPTAAIPSPPPSSPSSVSAPAPSPAAMTPPKPPTKNYRLVETGESVTPNEPGWPMRTTLRQIIMLKGELLEDAECPWPSTPIVHMTCIDVEDNPYGFGIVWKARHSNKTFSRATASIDRNTNLYGNAAQWLPTSVREKLQAKFGRAFIEPGDCLPIDTEDIPANGKFEPFITPPEIPDSLIIARRENRQDIEELMGINEVLQGEPVTPTASGELQKTAEQQAIGLITALSKRTQAAVQYLSELHLHSIKNFTTVDEMMATCRRYRRPVMAAIHLRDVHSVKLEAKASISSGAGMIRAQRRNDYLTLNQKKGGTGMPLVPDDMVLEEFAIDPAKAKELNMRDSETAQKIEGQMAMQQAAAVPSPASAPPRNGKPNNRGVVA